MSLLTLTTSSPIVKGYPRKTCLSFTMSYRQEIACTMAVQNHTSNARTNETQNKYSISIQGVIKGR